MKKQPLFVQGLLLYVLCIGLYVSLGTWLQTHWLLAGIAISQLGFLLIPALIYLKFSTLPWQEVLPLKRPGFWETGYIILLTALLLGFLTALLQFQAQFWPAPQPLQEFYENLIARHHWYETYLQLLALALIPAVCEEALFRGLLFGLWLPRLGSKKTILLTALLFTLAHANPWFFLQYFALGIFLGWIRVRKNNLALCMLGHFLNNLYAIVSLT